MAGTASSGNHRYTQIVIQPGDAGDGNREAVEQGLSSYHGSPSLRRISVSVLFLCCPRIKQIEDRRVKGCAGGVAAQRIIDAQKEILLGKSDRSAGGAVVKQNPSSFIEHLRGEDAGFKCADRVHRGCVRRCGGLRMTQGGVDGLLEKIFRNGLALGGFPAVPHHRAQKFEVGARQLSSVPPNSDRKKPSVSTRTPPSPKFPPPSQP